MKKLFLLLFLQITASVFFLINAQSTFSGWLASFNTFKTGKKTSIHTDIQLRSTDEMKQVQTLLIRPGFNVHLNKYLTVTAGYAFISNKRIAGNTSGFMPEHRIWEQLLVNHKLKNIFVSHRFRLEQRFIAKSIVVDDELEQDGSAYANRFRYFIRTVLPLKKQPVFKKGLFAALQNEVFLNFGNVATVNGETFDQNRLYMAVGYRLNARFDLETGYLNQYVNGRNKSFTNNHVVQLAGYLRL
jgi:hypothetical protein